ncbi:MAG: IclR family transcriptional regulator [Desulfobacterales bacterium]|nr:IclR family transcriptional regulator [Desulfobacterales bacterium]
MEQYSKKLGSIEKALATLLSFQGEKQNWGVRELSTHTGLNPATVCRILKILENYEFIEQNAQNKKYHLGNSIHRFTNPLQNAGLIADAARPYMKRLLFQTQETVHLNVIEKMSRVCVEKFESTQKLKVSIAIGDRFPLHIDATSRCLLAFSSSDFIEDYLNYIKQTPFIKTAASNIPKLRIELKTIKTQGYASSLCEHTPGFGVISAPMINHKGTVVAAMSLAVPEIRFSNNDHLSHCKQKLIEAASSVR